MKKFIFTLLLTVISVCTWAEVVTGTCGEELTYSLDTGTGVLSITGKGQMTDYKSSSSSCAPWYNYRTNIQSINIGSNVSSIGSYAFYGCTSLTSIAIGDNVQSIGAYAFTSCSGLSSITIPASVRRIKTTAFGGCKRITSVNTTNIGSWCNIYFDDPASNPASITHSLLLNGQEIKNLVVPDTVTSIGDNAFYQCTGLISVSIPNSVRTIGLDAFDGCTNLAKLEFGNSIKSIDAWAFHDCNSLTSIVLPNSLETLGSCAFANCSGIKTLTIGNSLTKIENSTFYQCTGITSVNIPNSVTSIEQSAFEGCSKLATVTVPKSVTKMANSMFANCPSLVTIYNYATTPQRIYSSSFSNSANCIVYVPFGCKVTYEGTQYWKDFKEIREMEPTAIEEVDATNTVNFNMYYNINGTKSSTLHPGLNIVKTQKGVIKVLK